MTSRATTVGPALQPGGGDCNARVPPRPERRSLAALIARLDRASVHAHDVDGGCALVAAANARADGEPRRRAPWIGR